MTKSCRLLQFRSRLRLDREPDSRLLSPLETRTDMSALVSRSPRKFRLPSKKDSRLPRRTLFQSEEDTGETRSELLIQSP